MGFGFLMYLIIEMLIGTFLGFYFWVKLVISSMKRVQDLEESYKERVNKGLVDDDEDDDPTRKFLNDVHNQGK